MILATISSYFPNMVKALFWMEQRVSQISIFASLEQFQRKCPMHYSHTDHQHNADITFQRWNCKPKKEGGCHLLNVVNKIKMIKKKTLLLFCESSS